MKITDALLDQLHRLQLRRQSEIADHGVVVTCITTGAVHRAALEEQTWFFSTGAPVAPGQVYSHADAMARFLVTATTDEAGRTAATMMHLPATATFFQAAPSGQDPLGRVHYKMLPTAWRDIPCTRPQRGKLTLPATYAPDRGDVLLIESNHYQVEDHRTDGATCIVTVTEF